MYHIDKGKEIQGELIYMRRACMYLLLWKLAVYCPYTYDFSHAIAFIIACTVKDSCKIRVVQLIIF